MKGKDELLQTVLISTCQVHSVQCTHTRQIINIKKFKATSEFLHIYNSQVYFHAFLSRKLMLQLLNCPLKCKDLRLDLQKSYKKPHIAPGCCNPSTGGWGINRYRWLKAHCPGKLVKLMSFRLSKRCCQEICKFLKIRGGGLGLRKYTCYQPQASTHICTRTIHKHTIAEIGI